MLKIKDNVDLKELEKYGFKEYNRASEPELRRYYDFKYPNAVTSIYYDRTIENWDDSFTELGIPYDEELLQDLIKADLVEKID